MKKTIALILLLLSTQTDLYSMERQGTIAPVKQKQAALFEKYKTIGQCRGIQSGLTALQLSSALNVATDLFVAHMHPATKASMFTSAAAHTLIILALYKASNILEQKKWAARQELPALIEDLNALQNENVRTKRKTLSELYKNAADEHAISWLFVAGDVLSIANIAKNSYIASALDDQGPCDPYVYATLSLDSLVQEVVGAINFFCACKARYTCNNINGKINSLLQELDMLIERDQAKQ